MKKLAIFSALLLLIFSCQYATQSTEDVFYPLKVGNSWDYARTITMTQASGEPGVLDSLNWFGPSKVHVYVDAIVTLSGEYKTYCIKTRENTEVVYSENFYLNNSNGLYNVAYRNPGASPVAFPKPSESPKFKFRGKTYNSIGQLCTDYHIDQSRFYKVTSDSLIYEDPPVQSLKYPLQVGAQWTYHANPWHMVRHVESQTIRSTPAGSFDCFEIKMLYDQDRNGLWDNDIYMLDYVAAEGLIERQIHVNGMIRMNESGEELGTFDYLETMVLTAYSL